MEAKGKEVTEFRQDLIDIALRMKAEGKTDQEILETLRPLVNETHISHTLKAYGVERVTLALQRAVAETVLYNINKRNCDV